MEFEYDPKKSLSNKAKHGISFEEAKVLWSVPAIEIQALTTDELRFMLIGQIQGKCYSCIYTIRNRVIRLISVRRSRNSEEKIYNDHVQKA